MATGERKRKREMGRGEFRLKPHIEVRFKWMWFPIAIFQSPNVSLTESSKKKFDTASSRSIPQQLYQRFNGEIWVGSDDVRGRKDRRRYRQLPAICCLRRCLTRRQLLKLQSRTADEKNPRRQPRIWRGKSTTSPAQRSTTAGAILFGVADRVHIHLKPTSMCGINVATGKGGGRGEGRWGEGWRNLSWLLCIFLTFQCRYTIHRAG